MAENKCDELFGKNGELVEFRKKQVLEGAFGIIQRHYEDKPSKMEAVAALFDKKLDQRFTIQCSGGKHEVMLTVAGLDVLDYGGLFADELGRMFLEDLLTGEAVVVDESRR